MKTELQMLQGDYSDLFKEIYGCRPTAAPKFWNDKVALQEEIEHLLGMFEQEDNE